MFSIPKASQTTFIYGPTIYENLIPKDNILYKINQVIDFSFVNEACSDLYSLDNGRPVKNTPEIMFRSAIVQYLNDFSDRQIKNAARYNLIIKWFIGMVKRDGKNYSS